jgi:hypothetical protein
MQKARKDEEEDDDGRSERSPEEAAGHPGAVADISGRA